MAVPGLNTQKKNITQHENAFVYYFILGRLGLLGDVYRNGNLMSKKVYGVYKRL